MNIWLKFEHQQWNEAEKKMKSSREDEDDDEFRDLLKTVTSKIDSLFRMRKFKERKIQLKDKIQMNVKFRQREDSAEKT